MKSNNLVQKLGLFLFVLSVGLPNALARVCTDDGARAKREFDFQNDKIAVDGAKLLQLKKERDPYSILVRSTHDHLTLIEKSKNRNRRNLEALKNAMVTGQSLFEVLLESDSHRKTLADSLEAVFKELQSSPGQFDRATLNGDPELRVLLAPLENKMDPNSDSLFWQAGMILLSAARTSEANQIIQSRDRLMNFYEILISNIENQELDNDQQFTIDQKNLAPAEVKLSEYDQQIRDLETSIETRTRIREASAAEMDKPPCQRRERELNPRLSR